MRTVSRPDPAPTIRSAFAGFCFPPDRHAEVITGPAATYPVVLEELLRRPGIALTSTPTIALSVTMAG